MTSRPWRGSSRKPSIAPSRPAPTGRYIATGSRSQSRPTWVACATRTRSPIAIVRVMDRCAGTYLAQSFAARAGARQSSGVRARWLVVLMACGGDEPAAVTPDAATADRSGELDLDMRVGDF